MRAVVITRNGRINMYLLPDLSNSKKKKFLIGKETYIFDKSCVIDDSKTKYIFYKEGIPHPLKFEENGVKIKSDTLTELLNLNFLEKFLSEPKMMMLTLVMIMLQILTMALIFLRR